MLIGPGQVKTDLWPGKVEQFRLEEGGTEELVGIMVSIAPLDDDNYVIANYGKLTLFNRKTKELSLLKPQMSPALHKEYGQGAKGKSIYNPTGVFFSTKWNRLFVANYTGNNILIGSIDRQNRMFLIKDVIGSRYTISPENVYVSDDGKWLVCANYDGDSVTAYDISGSPAKFMWSTPVGKWAHGVCIADDRVYATGLTARAVFELDLKTGAILRKSGSQGWNPAKTEFMWPTCVYPFSPGELIVSDAHNGIVYLIDRRTLKARKYFGGNGPTFNYFNMPYCAIVHNGEIVILSTYQRRILFGDRSSFRINEVVCLDRNAWEYMREKKVRPPRLGTGWEGYIWRHGPVAHLLGRDYILGFSHLYPKSDDGKRYDLLVPIEPGSLFNSSGQLYFLNIKSLDDGFILFTPERGQAFLVYQGAATYLFPILLEMDCWSVDNEIYAPSGKKDLTGIVDDVRKNVRLMESKRESSGILKREVLHRTMFAEYTDERFEAGFKGIFKSKSGLRFYDEYVRCSSSHCTKEQAQSIARKYYDGIKDEPEVNLDELMTVHMTTGVSP